MGWLALVFMWFILTVLRGKYDRFVFGALAAGFAVLFGLNVLNPVDFIVRVNAGRVNTTNGFDASYVAGLSADAVPALIEALPRRFCGVGRNLKISICWRGIGIACRRGKL